MSTWDLLAGLELTVDACTLEGRSAEVSSGFTRQTTLIQLQGNGQCGIGEDVTYDGVDHDAFQVSGPPAALPTGTMPLGDWCAGVEQLDLFSSKAPERDVSRLYRRWAFDSAGLDLALRQAGIPLADALGRDAGPMSFVVSVRLGEPSTLDPVERRLEIDPTLKFKLDPREDWDDAILAALASTGAVESVDFKALYENTMVDQTAGVDLYRRVVEALPGTWIEDPGLADPEIDEFLLPHRDRITWDAPIHSIRDLEALPFQPRTVNVKPSRLGGLESLLEMYDHCERLGIGCYGGGQFELGPGRGQNQILASIFHPHGANDLAPTGWNEPDPQPPLASSPLQLEPAPSGFILAADP